MKRALVVLAGLLLLLVGFCVLRATLLSSRQQSFAKADASGLDAPEQMASRFARALTFRTVSRAEPPFVDDEPFAQLRTHIREAFPLIHQQLGQQVVNRNSLLLTWAGSDAALPAVLSIAHQDVVPVEESSIGSWTHPPFGGVIADGFIWGRGALDDKARLFAQLEAVEAMLRGGFVPKRTVYFAFGHDEEVGGSEGAVKLAEHLTSKGARVEFMLDEGLPITVGVIKGVDVPVAAVGIAEKGVLDVELVVSGEGGHSSAPPPNTAAGIVAAAVAKLEANPFPARGGPHIDSIGAFAGPHMPFGQRIAFANLWLLRPVVLRSLQGKPGTAALTRTTIAATMLEGSARSNVLPIRARAVVNLRLLPGDTVEGTLTRLREVIADERVTVSSVGELKKEPSELSSIDSRGFKAMERAIRETHPEAIVVPTLVVGTTDTPHYAKLTKDSYRHYPFVLGAEDIKRLHGTDERLSVEAYARAVLFYRQLFTHSTSE